MTDEDLDKIYHLNNDGKIDEAIDIIYEFLWGNYDFAIIDEFYSKIDVSKITDGAILVAPVMVTWKYVSKLNNHIPYCKRAVERYRELGYDEDRIHRIMNPYMKTDIGDYWKIMESLGAPEWLAGKKIE